MTTRTLENFGSYLLRCYSRKTSSRPKDWRKASPSYGHCAVVALVLCDYFGATIKVGEIPPEIAYQYRTGFLNHCWNTLNGERIDFTREQFAPEFPYDDLVAGRLGVVREVTRKTLLRNRLLRTNYRVFAQKLSRLRGRPQITSSLFVLQPLAL